MTELSDVNTGNFIALGNFVGQETEQGQGTLLLLHKS